MHNIKTNSQTAQGGLRRMGWYGMLLYLGLLSQVQDAVGTRVTEEAKLTASDARSNAPFGISVALSADGNTALVGAPRAWHCSGSCGEIGAAYVFVHTGSIWVEQQKLIASDPDVGGSKKFGTSVALSSDGKVAIIGRPHHGDLYDTRGTVYVFVLEGSEWIEQQKLTKKPGDFFGSSVALSSDSNLLIVGAPSSIVGGGGASYVFVREGNSWVEQQKLTALDTEFGDFFGSSVALSANGNVGLIGAPSNDTVGLDDGASYVFVREGDTWVIQEKLTVRSSFGISYGFVGWSFGSSVSLSAKGNRALVGAPVFPYTDNGYPRWGVAFVFVREGDTWKKQKKFTTPAGALGGAVALSDNGKKALIREAASAVKKAHMFVRKGITWVKKYTLRPSDDGPLSGGSGSSVALSAKGKVLLVGAPEANCPGIIDCGAAYVFRP
jgi:FG-GAP repeat